MPRLGSELPLHNTKNDDHRPHAVEAYPNNANKRIVILRMVIVFLFIMILRNVFLDVSTVLTLLILIPCR